MTWNEKQDLPLCYSPSPFYFFIFKILKQILLTAPRKSSSKETAPKKVLFLPQPQRWLDYRDAPLCRAHNLIFKGSQKYNFWAATYSRLVVQLCLSTLPPVHIFHSVNTISNLWLYPTNTPWDSLDIAYHANCEKQVIFNHVISLWK